MKLYVGKMVWYTSYGTPKGEYTSEVRAAVVTAIHANYVVDICVLNPTGQFFNTNVQHSVDPKPGHWSYIPDTAKS